ncbi:MULTISPECIES: hypothetical protein [unclassified Acinetobacter]|uniref:hypothetical protein n=1 Tax=unclassified Acinetobacter TaxID=196816 RepID=UPI0015D1CE13|nr:MULTISPECIES: hypothetical protein [unclassified Acinetobacter]QOW50141.1 hypothetical protein G0029_10300 [Acinetobacter sp. YH12138]
MKKSILFTAFFIFFTVRAEATTLQQQINNRVQVSIKNLNLESKKYAIDSDYFKFSLKSKEVTTADINNDGIKDRIIVLNFCEETTCHPTTMSSEVAVFIGKKDQKFNFLDSKYFAVTASIQKDKKGNINVHQYDYFEDDGHCCPSRLTKFDLTVKDGKLISSKIN